ncbi:tumor necrosis factor receptor superfamily member wengen isoform X2 [Arctopsyche grandis]|uniref:tumor necrosis factor receptor superfamily member wengen isoform X2 n=1 Tax=Arctopsyche grandis TaxID=121162 RepID=UPI00406D6FBC
MLASVWETALVLAASLAAAEGLICRPGRTWWNSEKASCLECRRCEPPLLVIRPCEHHRDAECAPISDLHIDWSWLARPHHNRHHRRPEEHNEDQSTMSSGSHEYDDNSVQVLADADSKYYLPVTSDHGGSSNDNQAITMLSLAIAMCILFLVLVGVYSVYYARQWRILKENLQAVGKGKDRPLGPGNVYIQENNNTY